MTAILDQLSDFLNIGKLGSWLIFFATATAFTILFWFVRQFFVNRFGPRARQSPNPWDDVVVDLVAKTKVPIFYVWSAYLILPALEAPASVESTIHTIFIVCTTIQFTLWGIYLVGVWRNLYLNRRVATDASSLAAIGIVSRILEAAVATVIILTGMKQLHIDIGAFVAGLGVGGVAIALAAQSILGDLLASLSIVLDKPFVNGDFIIVGNDMGTVEYIGIKSTRVRALSGELLIFSNKDLLNSRIQNFKAMRTRRASIKLSVPLTIPSENIEMISKWVSEIVSKEEKLKLDHCNFIGFGAGTYDYELAFFVSDPDSNVFLAIQQRLIAAIAQKFKAEGFGFGLPAQSLVFQNLQDSAPKQ